MSRSPNAEQLLAIEHQGGVLLRAGAGSGKTFVLVEHIRLHKQDFLKCENELVYFDFVKEIADEEIGFDITNYKE